MLILSKQIRRREKSDIYDVGALLWEISSGHPPLIKECGLYDFVWLWKFKQVREKQLFPILLMIMPNFILVTIIYLILIKYYFFDF